MPATKHKHRRPDHYLFVDAFAPGQRLQRIPCKIYLDLAAAHRSRVILLPDRVTAHRLLATRSWSLIGYLPSNSPNRSSYIRIPSFEISSAPTTHWLPDLEETRVYGHASAIIVSSALQGSVAPHARGVAYLHGGRIVRPRGIRMRSYTGAASFRRTWRCRARLDASTLVTFDSFIAFPRVGGEEGIEQTGLSARLPAPLGGPESTLRRWRDGLEDVLTLVSIAGRERTAWHRLDASDGHVFVHYYDTQRRRPLARPSALGPLIEKHDLPDFLERCFPCLRQSASRPEVIAAGFALAPYRSLPLETTYLATFGALEALTIRLVGGPAEAQLLGGRRWGPLSKKIKNTIRSWQDPEGALTRKQRSAMYRKVPELNRAPFGDTWDDLLRTRGVPVHDLWPMHNVDGQLGLLALRHKLAHGQIAPTAAVSGLAVALHHLRWTLERLALDALGWDITRTDASPTRLVGRGLLPAVRLAEHLRALTRAWPD